MEQIKVNKSTDFKTRSQEAYGRQKEAGKKIIDFVNKNPEEIIHLSVTEVAEKSNTSESSVVRLCKNLGYKGFQDFKINLARDIITPEKQIHESVHPGDDIKIIKKKIFSSNIQALYDSNDVLSEAMLSEATNKILGAERIEIYGTGGSASVAFDAQHKLLKLGIKSQCYSDNTLQNMSASVLGEKDIVIGISHTGTSTDILEALKLAKKRGATIICITNLSKSPITKISDINLQTMSNETMFRTDAISSRIAQLTIIDILIAAIANSDYSKFQENVQSIRESTSYKKI